MKLTKCASVLRQESAQLPEYLQGLSVDLFVTPVLEWDLPVQAKVIALELDVLTLAAEDMPALAERLAVKPDLVEPDGYVRFWDRAYEVFLLQKIGQAWDRGYRAIALSGLGKLYRMIEERPDLADEIGEPTGALIQLIQKMAHAAPEVEFILVDALDMLSDWSITSRLQGVLITSITRDGDFPNIELDLARSSNLPTFVVVHAVDEFSAQRLAVDLADENIPHTIIAENAPDGKPSVAVFTSRER